MFERACGHAHETLVVGSAQPTQFVICVLAVQFHVIVPRPEPLFEAVGEARGALGDLLRGAAHHLCDELYGRHRLLVEPPTTFQGEGRFIQVGADPGTGSQKKIKTPQKINRSAPAQ